MSDNSRVVVVVIVW